MRHGLVLGLVCGISLGIGTLTAPAQQLPGVPVNTPPTVFVQSQFAVDAVAPPSNAPVIVGGTFQPPQDPFQPPPNPYQQSPFQPPVVASTPQETTVPPTPQATAEVRFDWTGDNLFYYTWIDFGEGNGLRIHRLEWTNGWTDMRAPDFFTRPTDDTHHFEAGLSFAVQWWKERILPDKGAFGSSIPPPVLYDLYLDLDWRTEIARGWVVDLAVSPGLSTDFRVTPPDGFRLRGHAITMVDIAPSLRGVLGIWYLNHALTKLLPVAGFVWQADEATRLEAVFPQPRLVHELGCWKDRKWEVSLGGEFGGGGWAFKNPEGERETIDYRDFRAVAGLHWTGGKAQGWIEVGYIFQRQLRYSEQQNFDFDPGNAIMMRIGCAY